MLDCDCGLLLSELEKLKGVGVTDLCSRLRMAKRMLYVCRLKL